MKKIFMHAGNAAAIAGILVCLMAGLARLSGLHYVLGFEAVTLFIMGIALMVAACLAKLHMLGAITADRL